MPPKFAWVVRLLGFQADRAEGLRELRRISSLSQPRAHFASTLSLWILIFYLEDDDAVDKLHDDVADAAPTLLSRFLFGYSLRRKGCVEEAQRHFSALWDASTHFSPFHMLVLYERAWCDFLLRRWHLAVPALFEFLRNHSAKTYRAYAIYQLGVALAALGRQSEALDAWTTTAEAVRRNYSWDAYAARKSSQFCCRGFREIDLQLVEAYNSMRCKDSAACAAIATSALLLSHDDADVGQILALLRSDGADGVSPAPPLQQRTSFQDVGGIIYSVGRCAISEEISSACFETLWRRRRELGCELFYAPFAMIRWSRMRLRGGRPSEARAMMDEVGAAMRGVPFDFDKAFHRKAQRMYEMIDHADEHASR